MLYYIGILLIVVSNVFYHIIQKLTPPNINPIFSLIITYLTAAVFCLILLPFYPNKESLLDSFKKLNWASFALGVSIIGLELGFLLAYRAGWNISLAQFYSTVLVTLLLVPIGILFFHEKLTLINLIGMLLCFSGFILINYK